MDDAFAGHFVDEGNRLLEGVPRRREIVGVDRRANGLQRATQPRAELPATCLESVQEV